MLQLPRKVQPRARCVLEASEGMFPAGATVVLWPRTIRLVIEKEAQKQSQPDFRVDL